MSDSVIKDSYSIDRYDDTLSIMDNIVAKTLNAYKDENNTHYNLTLGASSNINIEAARGVNVYFNSSNATKLYNSTYVGDIRTDTNILNISICFFYFVSIFFCQSIFSMRFTISV